MKPYENMDHETLKREYSPSSCIDDIMVFIDQYIEKSAAVREKLKDNIRPNIKYGPEQRSHMDVFVPDGDGPFPVHVFIHGGYWQQLSKDESSFAAENFIDHDIIFIALDYTLAPEANIHEIIDQTRRGIISVLKNAAKFNGDPDNITISGSSAGGHLVAEVLSTDWQKYGYESCPFKGALTMSGVFDLVPLVKTYVNDPLKMTEKDAHTASPINHVPDNCCPIIFTVGENETSEFHRQTHEYKEACNKKGIPTSYVEMPIVNHFDIVFSLAEKNGALFQAVLKQIKS